ncbi:hypothetical protein BBJ28_00017447 [Nothophytophthora sp. Chile5]|nr:hypothetical protein BBJ28_00017447 [Nothophytophthora sp. Chile5]
MAGGGPNIGSYSPLTGFVFIFNLIVGAGALTIPHAFANVGLLYGSLALSVLASVSYVTATFMLEAIAGVNALKQRARELGLDEGNGEKRAAADLVNSDDDDAHTEFLPLMVANEVLFPVPKSLREIICPRPAPDVVVWECSKRFNSSDLYRLFVVLFGLLLSPFTFGHVHKTRTLQLVTTVIRHASFGLMILLAIIGIAHGHGRSVADVVSYEKPANIATFFGVIPGLVAPITDKAKVGTVLASSFVDVYTLNFKNYPVQVFAYFLSLFPVFTLSASFPLICITLRENIRHLATRLFDSSPAQSDAAPVTGFYGFLEKNVYALVALVPPLVVAFFTEDVSMLVGFTGAYAGLGIQWVVPTFLVLCLRRRLAEEWKQIRPMQAAVTRPGTLAARGNKNQFASPFAHQAWLYVVFAFSLASVVLITITHGMN